jgi:sigma-B regulation protein RsbU (phosphoserine phosphatase)
MSMPWSYPVLRRRLQQDGFWPEGRVARIAWYLLGLGGFLFALRGVLALFAPSWGASLGGWAEFLAGSAGVLFLFLGFGWLRRKILWRLRNRLIVTYVFIGVIPAVLLVAMAGITLYGLAGQFAVFVVTSEINAQLRSLEAVNAAVTNELAARLERGQNPAAESLAGLKKRDPAWGRRQVCAWYGDKPLPLCDESKGSRLTLPSSKGAQFRDIVRDHGELHLRVVTAFDLGANRLVVITSEPFDKELVGNIAANLGEISLSASTPEAQPTTAPVQQAGLHANATITPEKKKGFEYHQNEQGT